jgi:hypothetical protein
MSQGTKRALGAVILAALLAGCTCSSSTEPPPPEPKAAKVKRAKGEVKPEAAEAEVAPLNDALKAAPNVLLIVWDTVRADHMSAYGYNKPTTPRIAAWSKQGVRYDRAVSAGVWTLPSHASLFTGLPERAHGVNADYNWLDSEHLTVAEAMGSPATTRGPSAPTPTSRRTRTCCRASRRRSSRGRRAGGRRSRPT